MKSLVLIPLFMLVAACASTTELDDKHGNTSPVLKTSVEDVIQGNKARVMTCYTEYLANGGKKSGKQMYQWDITKTGRAIDVKIAQDDIGDRKLTSCVADVITTMAFPALDQADAARIKYPFVFNNPKNPMKRTN